MFFHGRVVFICVCLKPGEGRGLGGLKVRFVPLVPPVSVFNEQQNGVFRRRPRRLLRHHILPRSSSRGRDASGSTLDSAAPAAGRVHYVVSGYFRSVI